MSSPAVRPLAPSETFGVKAVHDPSLRRGDRPAAGQRWENEAAFQQAVVDLARWRRWLVYFVPDSRRSPAGWPDLVLVRRGVMVAAELKSRAGRLRPEQRTWLDALDGVPGVRVYVWRSTDWPEIERVLA